MSICLGIHGRQPLFDFGARLAQGAAEIAIVVLARNQRRFLIAIRLGQIGPDLVVEIARVRVGIQNFYSVLVSSITIYLLESYQMTSTSDARHDRYAAFGTDAGAFSL